MKAQTLKEIWDLNENRDFSYLVVEDQEGNRAYIDGCRSEDPEGGCMATGTLSCVYGRTAAGEHWFNHPQFKSMDSAEWTLVGKYREDFYIRNLEDFQVYRGLEETETGYWVLLKNGHKVHYSKSRCEKVPTQSICVCCYKDMNQPRKGILAKLFNR